LNNLMNYKNKIIYVFFLFTISVSFIGCSPSTRFQRYNHQKSDNEKSAQIENDTTAETASEKTDVKTTPGATTVVNNLPGNDENEFDEVPVEINPVDKSKFVAHFEKLKNANVTLTPREKILFEVIKYLETPYKYGGSSEDGTDCSGFTKQVFENSVSFELPRSAREQYGVGDKIDKDELKFGDLVFFNTRRRSNPGHVGIYIGDNQFVHASRQLGVTISSLDETYYKKRYTGARRVMETEE
jgi:cell wall-associated NlpC family hydrolase